MPHGFNFKGAASDFGIDYFMPKTCKEFEAAYKDACIKAENCSNDNNKIACPVSIIEVVTDRQHNLNLRKKIKKEIIDWLNSGGILGK